MTTAVLAITPDTGTARVDVPHLVAFDLYRDIHKAIRCEMFAVTAAAGSIDPADLPARRELTDRIHALIDLLVHHAEHEDGNLDVVIMRLDPALGLEIASAHIALETRMQRISRLASAATETDHARRASHALYLELASFTASYLQHQDFEERVVMRTLDQNLTLEELLDLHGQILGSVAPDVMKRCLQLMLPAINILDRIEMLGGMAATAPPEVFAAVWQMAGDVLSTREYLATAARLGLTVDAAKIN